jgi:hypothetical protein
MPVTSVTVNSWLWLFNVVLCFVNTAPCVPSGKCSVCVYSSHFWRTVWKVFCLCLQYTFLTYRVESVLFVCTVHISNVPCGKCSVCVHSTHFWCTVWKVFCFCAQYTFLVSRFGSAVSVCTVHISDVPSESVLFVFTVHISDVPPGKCSVSVHSTHFCCPTMWYFLK